jgi:catechol-2,3-dioxygenase
MLSIRGVYEAAIRVGDLSRSEPFYRDLLGLTPGLRDERRNWIPCTSLTRTDMTCSSVRGWS